MSKIAVALLLIVPVWTFAWPGPADEPREMLAQAELLYEAADFPKSVELLLRADELLQKTPAPLEIRASVKMQLALGFMGLNNNDRAKAYFLELYKIDSSYRLDTQNLAPKVIALADEAKVEQNATKCRSIVDEAQNQLQSGNSEAVVSLIGSSSGNCPAINALIPKTADLIYKDGMEAFRKSQMTDALKKFRAALSLDPTNDMATQYAELTQTKIEVTAERTLIAWRRDFNAGDFVMAARDFKELVPVSDSKTVSDIRQEYQQTLSGLADSWKRACSSEDAAAMEKLRARADELIPEPEFGRDTLDAMQGCLPTSCVPTESRLAMTRIDKRVDPEFPPSVVSHIRNLSVTVRVKARIDVKGNVAITDIQGGDPILYSAIREAVNQWKFRPTLTELGARCVDTEIPIVIRASN